MKLPEDSILGCDDGVPRLAARQVLQRSRVFTEDGSSVVTLHED